MIKNWLKKLSKPRKKINVESIRDLLNDPNFFTPMYAKMIEATKCKQTGAVLYTLELFFPRYILAEQNTHRKFSRNTGSSRAIPLLRMLAELVSTPVVPLFWGANKAGMQSAEELPVWKQYLCAMVWNLHRKLTFLAVRFFAYMGLHKQWGNRLLEPHTYIRQVVTTSDLSNYYDLRIHDDAQPEIILLALMIKREVDKANQKGLRKLDANKISFASAWHLPYITEAERVLYNAYPSYLAKLSAARCARTSYLTQEGVEPKPEKEIETFRKLAESKPIHASPLEHQGYPFLDVSKRSRNFDGYMQYRELYETKEFGAKIIVPKV